MDFYTIKERSGRNGVTEVYPDFKVVRSKDLMVQGRSFYAIWDEEKGLWSTDEYDVQRLVDEDLMRRKDELGKKSEGIIQAKLMSDFSSSSWLQFRSYVNHISDSSHPLDENLTFSNTKVKKTDYVSRRLSYPLAEGDYSAWDELVGTLYSEEERAKLEWAMGSVIAGDSKDIQKFVVLYGSAGAGKSTILNIIQKLFSGYYTTFEAKALASNNNSFATEVFKSNPLVAIQHDGDLSKIEDNSKLNSIISHEEMTMNEKYKPSYMSRINAFLFMATNKPVKITDAKSGIIRRLIDVQPSGKKLPGRRYQALMSQVDFELGSIAYHCLNVYRDMGKDYYAGYQPVEMMLQTDVFYNYIEANFDLFKAQNGVTLNQAYELYKVYTDEALIDYKVAKHRFREELKNYFERFLERAEVDGIRVRSWYDGFKTDKFTMHIEDEEAFSLVLDHDTSIFDEMCKDQPAQYANEYETPTKFWSNNQRIGKDGREYIPSDDMVVSTVLSDIDTTKLHYVKPGLNHIVIDFDLKDEHGVKSAEKNLEAASKWPSTYAEFSKGGGGIHLHYIYSGDPTRLSRIYSEGIEIKVFTGDSSLRRKLSKCNNVPVATLRSGLPLKEKKVINTDAVKSEKGLRALIDKNLRKEIHPGTKPSMDFIHKILEDAYSSDLKYDVTDMRPKILAFANNSSNQALYCIKLVQHMKFSSDTAMEEELTSGPSKDDRLVFFDVEVFPNLFVICWKYQGTDKVVRMINPSVQAVEELMQMKLVGYNCRRYDNHILYGASMGYSNEQLYRLSKKIIDGTPNALFGSAYEISFSDIYDFASEKKSLKKWGIELKLTHVENHHPWDEPVPESDFNEIADYCANDVELTEAVFEHRKYDFVAREILAELSGLSVNSTTQQHAAKIIFGSDKEAQKKFVYTDLSEQFPGYTYDHGTSTYKGEVTGEGGYVYAEPGMYTNVALLDVASMHPASIENLDLFGPYTEKFSDIKKARLAIKRNDYESARQMLDGRLTPYLKDEANSEALSYALKIVINIVYGLTSAKFDNPFRDRRNKDNIVAKRGALFMIDLKEAVQKEGYTVAHIKTDSIKIPNADKAIIDFVMDFGEQYGYSFEHEATYDKLCLVNDAVYVAKVEAGRAPARWTAVGAQFQHPYVFKTLFSKEKIEFDDLCETKSVTTALYLDFNSDDVAMGLENPYHFVGKIGRFCPMSEGGGLLLREKDGKFHSATGAKGYRWMESEMVKSLNKQKSIDESYFKKLTDSAVEKLSGFGDVEWFLSEEG